MIQVNVCHIAVIKLLGLDLTLILDSVTVSLFDLGAHSEQKTGLSGKNFQVGGLAPMNS